MPLENLKKLTLYVVRHGQTITNTRAGIMGQNDSPMTALGRAQVRNNAKLLRKVAGDDADTLDYIASPLHRASESMEIMLSELGLYPHSYRADRRLMEIDFGLHSDWTWADMNADPHGKNYLTDQWTYQ